MRLSAASLGPVRRTLAAAGALLVAATPAGAIVHVRGEMWKVFPAIPTLPAIEWVVVAFEADLTERDRTHGVEFRIDVPGPDASSTTPILKFFRDVPALPADLESASFLVRFALSCEMGGGRLLVEYPEAWMSYFVAGTGLFRVHVDTEWTQSAAVQGTFGLTIRDETLAPGANPIASQRLYCYPTDRFLGVYFDSEGTVCHGTIHPGAPGLVYVLAKLGTNDAGIAGAEFRFDGVPASWQTYAEADPSMVTIGDPFGRGVSMGFPCQHPGGGVVLLYSVLVLAASEESDVAFRILRRDPPSNPEFHCPVVMNCDAPVYTAVCVGDVPCTVNPTRPVPCNVPTAAWLRSWSAVKGLYR